MRTISVGLPARKAVATSFVQGRKLVSRPRPPKFAAFVAQTESLAGGRYQTSSAKRKVLSKSTLAEQVTAELRRSCCSLCAEVA